MILLRVMLFKLPPLFHLTLHPTAPIITWLNLLNISFQKVYRKLTPSTLANICDMKLKVHVASRKHLDTGVRLMTTLSSRCSMSQRHQTMLSIRHACHPVTHNSVQCKESVVRLPSLELTVNFGGKCVANTAKKSVNTAFLVLEVVMVS